MRIDFVSFLLFNTQYPKALIDRLKSELSGATEDLVVALLKAERQEGLVDDGLAVKQAKELHDAGIGKRMGTDKKTFIRILSQASREQIQVMVLCRRRLASLGRMRWEGGEGRLSMLFP